MEADLTGKGIFKHTRRPISHTAQVLASGFGVKSIHNKVCRAKAMPVSRSCVSCVGQALGTSWLVAVLPTSHASFL